MRFVTSLAKLAVLAFGTISLTTGCATLIQPGPDHIAINSEPQGATVYLNGSPVGTTPMQLSINRADDANIMLKKDGYDSITYSRNKVVAGWVVADVIFWPSFLVDLATHSQGKYSEDPIFLSLPAAKQASSNSPAHSVGSRDVASSSIGTPNK